MTGEEDRSVGRNLCLVMVREGGTLEKIAVAAAFHDLGIWTHKTFDYIPPSVALAHEYLTAHGRADWISYGHASIPGRVRPSDRWLVRCRRWLHVPLSAWCWREPGRHGDPSYPTVSITVPHPVLPTQTATDVEESDRESWWGSGSLNIQAMVKLTPVASRFVGRVFGGPIYFSALQEPAVSGFQISESLDLSGGAYAVDLDDFAYRLVSERMMRTPTLDLEAMTAAPAPEFTSPLEALVARRAARPGVNRPCAFGSKLRL